MAVLDRALQSRRRRCRRSPQRARRACSTTMTRTKPPPRRGDAARHARVEREGAARAREGSARLLPSSHPLAEYRADAAHVLLAHHDRRSPTLAHRDEVLLGGMLAAIKFSHTKNPRPAARTPSTRCSTWKTSTASSAASSGPSSSPSTATSSRPTRSSPCAARSTAAPAARRANLIVNELIPLADLAERSPAASSSASARRSTASAGLEQLREILRGYPGRRSCARPRPGRRRPGVARQHSLAGRAHPELRQRVEALLGPGSFHLQAAAPRPSSSPKPYGRRASGLRLVAAHRVDKSLNAPSLAPLGDVDE